MKHLSIVIPAYNEEKAIQSIIERTLAASERIKSQAGLAGVEVIVVNDGSKDQTGRIASAYAENHSIRLISYPKNRGYGAAIKLGFEQSSGDTVSFLDADGTCDPLLLIDLLNKMKDENSDIVLGGRLNPNSEMPLTRRIGNLFYRGIVNAIGGSNVTDVASGMRVLRKDILKKLYPLPDGLNFTPAMSVCAILDKDIRIHEVPIPYKERIGKSKLSIFKDGFRFLKTILEIGFTYKPLRIFGFIGCLFLLLALIYGIDPVVHYLKYRNVPEDRIYRLVFIAVASVSGIQLISVGLITQIMTNLIHGYEMETRIEKLLDRTFLKKLTYFGIAFLLAAVVLNHRTITEYYSTRHISVHWSYVVTGGLLVLMGFQFLAFSIINRIIVLLNEKRKSASTPTAANEFAEPARQSQ